MKKSQPEDNLPGEVPFVATIPFARGKRLTTNRDFVLTGDHSYRMTMLPAGITFEVTHLHRRDRALAGELTVSINKENFPKAHPIGDTNILLWGDINFSATQTRKQWDKLLTQRAGTDDVDWWGCLEDLCLRLVEAERIGEPAAVMHALT